LNYGEQNSKWYEISNSAKQTMFMFVKKKGAINSEKKNIISTVNNFE